MKCMVLFALVGFVLVLSGCGMLGGGSGLAPIVTPELRTGAQGVAAEFLQASPPDVLFDDADVLVRFSLHNRGAAQVNRASYVLEANPGAFLVLDERAQGSFAIGGKQSTDPLGEKLFFEVGARTLAMPGNLETILEQLVLHTCYPYSTIASATVCVDTSVGSVREGAKVCTEGMVSLGGGQGGPVSLSAVNLQSVPLDEFRVRPQVELTFHNSGGGEVMLSQESDALCSGRLAESSNKARVRVFLSEVPMQCSSGELVFREGAAKIQCTLEEGIETIQGTFYSIVRAEVDYGYHQVERKSVRITRSAGRS